MIDRASTTGPYRNSLDAALGQPIIGIAYYLSPKLMEMQCW